jgi:hypothetical protein
MRRRHHGGKIPLQLEWRSSNASGRQKALALQKPTAMKRSIASLAELRTLIQHFVRPGCRASPAFRDDAFEPELAEVLGKLRAVAVEVLGQAGAISTRDQSTGISARLAFLGLPPCRQARKGARSAH